MKTTTPRSADLRSASRATLGLSSHRPLLVLCALLLMAGRSDAGEAADLSRASTARAKASPSSASRGQAGAGDSYAVSRTSGDWVEVQFGRGKVWLKRADVSIRQTALKRVTAASGLRVRKGAGAQFAALGALSHGVFVVDRGGSSVWTKISFEGRTGWVQSRFLRAEAGVAPAPGMISTIEDTVTAPVVTAPVVTAPDTDDDDDTPSAVPPVEEPAVTAPAATARAVAWHNGRKIGMIDVVTIDGKKVSKKTADAYFRMREAARRDGVHLSVVSGFRTYDEQAHLYRLYRAGRGNLAAPPGHSNHQNGWALDLNTHGAGVYRWLNRNARRFGFKRTVPSEKWHWEHR